MSIHDVVRKPLAKRRRFEPRVQHVQPSARTQHSARVAAIALSIVSLALAGETPETKLIDSNGEKYDYFGSAGSLPSGPVVAIDEEVIVVGVRYDDVGENVDQGSATIYRRHGGTWIEEQELVSAGGAPTDTFGSAVSVDGEVIVVGASSDKVGGLESVGSATVFRRNGGRWVQEQQIFSIKEIALRNFGAAVSLHGDVIVVGAPSAVLDEGSAEVFRWDGMSWIFEQELMPSAVVPGGRFGRSVSVSGDVIVVGDPLDDVGGADAQGSASVFRWSGSAWSEEQVLVASSGTALDWFGQQLSVDDDVIVVGVPFADVGGEGDAGAAVVFRWNGSRWLEEQQLVASDASAGDRFGSSVAVCGDVIAVGAPRDGVDGSPKQGSVSLFRWNGSEWLEQGELGATDGSPLDRFGSSVAVDGEQVVVTAPYSKVNGEWARGAAYVYDVTPSAWSDQGSALAGELGDPLLVGCGTLAAMTLNTLALTNAAQNAPAALFVAFAAGSMPFKGGVLEPIPPAIPAIPVPTDLSGSVALSFRAPSGLPPGTALWAQLAIVDAAAVQGVALSNAVRGIVP